MVFALRVLRSVARRSLHHSVERNMYHAHVHHNVLTLRLLQTQPHRLLTGSDSPPPNAGQVTNLKHKQGGNVHNTLRRSLSHAYAWRCLTLPFTDTDTIAPLEPPSLERMFHGFTCAELSLHSAIFGELTENSW